MSASDAGTLSADCGNGLTAQLLLHGAEIDSVFDLLGRTENDMTYALGWGWARSDAFLSAFLRVMDMDSADAHDVVVRLQQYEGMGGFTDIEVSVGADLHLIVEAKRGWWLPSRSQLDPPVAWRARSV